jgi:ketosteroid isomerase-like protein
MSEENVELIRSLFPGRDTDMIALWNDDSASGELMQTWAPLLDPDFVAVKHVPGAEPDIAQGLHGLREGWLDWLSPWASYRAEIEEMIDVGGRVVTVICDYGRREPDAQEVALKSAALWTVREQRIVRAEFYAGGRAEALKAVELSEQAVSEENIGVVRRIYAAYGRRDNEAPFDAYAPDVEWDISELGIFGAASVYHGHEGVRACFRDLFSAFREFEIRAEELRASGEHVLVKVWEHGVGTASGAVVDRQHHALWTLHDGKVVGMRVYIRRSDAEQAAGLTIA